MSEQSTEATTETTVEESQESTHVNDTTETEAEQQGDPADAPLGEGGKKALDAERKARKEAEAATAELRRQLQAVEDSKLSDLERAEKAAKEAEQRAAEAAALTEKLRIVARHGLTEADAEDLPDDLEKAERLAARLAEAKHAGPRPDPTQGGMGAVAKSKGDQFADFANTFFTR